MMTPRAQPQTIHQQNRTAKQRLYQQMSPSHHKIIMIVIIAD
jgi:hypothetical protein